MPTIAFVSPKGGVGKTTAAVLLATEIAQKGKAVTLIDADPNKPISTWARRKYSVSPSMSESALLVIAAGYVLCRPGLAGPSPSARVRPRTPPDNEWRDGGRVACAGAPAFTTSGCLLHRTAAVRRCRHLPGIIRCGLRTCMAGRARRRVRDTEGRIVYKLAHGGDYKYAPDH